jgi:DnaK suppressor protein
MKARDLKYFREKLVAKRTEVLDLVHKTEDYGRQADTTSETMDIADKASSSYTKEFMFSKSNVDRRLLQMISEAIVRLDDGKYGRCMNCEELIGQKRLEAVPWAILCIKCKELEEKGEL